VAVTTDQMYLLFQSIDASLKRLVAIAEKRLETKQGPAADLDAPNGNPAIKAKDPRDWTGDSMHGKRLSECPPEYLDLLAARYEYFNTLPDVDAKKAHYNRLDAARARGWAARLRAGWTAPAAAEASGFPSDEVTKDEIAF
jgi:hypothetical protein